MSHQPRLHAAGAHYYVVQRCCPGQRIFEKEEDYGEFSARFSELASRYQIKVHAFLWLPSEIHLIAQVGNIPLTKMMRSLMQAFAYRVGHKTDAAPLFPERYTAVLFDPQEYLLRALRFVHSRALTLTPTIDEYRWSSHGPYKGETPIPWLITCKALGLFNRHTHRGQRAYVTFMETPPSDEDVDAFGNVSSVERRVLGSTIFLRRMGLRVPAWKRITVASVAASVARNMGAELEEVRSRSRRRELSEVRAAIAAEVKARGVASQAATARYLGRGRSTLHGVVEHHCELGKQRTQAGLPRRASPIMSPAAIAAILACSEPIAASA